MATKARNAGLNAAMHSAGIYADMSLDGPVIGTLVVIIDRAKNLPNRRAMGKQDPYCAARLGKEAKKTTTDIRGGQTPRWDQELRFTVHDSPDYLKLKVSIFNDDKKTELIGEGWVQLDDVIVPGGGQADVWHTLHCKGKYAGEVRVEFTYYDTRPKVEKPAPKRRERAQTEGGRDSMGGPRLTPVKRRPLHADPGSTGSSGQSGQRPLSQVGGTGYQTPPRMTQYSNEGTPNSGRRNTYNQQQPQPVDSRYSYQPYRPHVEEDPFTVSPVEFGGADSYDISLGEPVPARSHHPEEFLPSQDHPPYFSHSLNSRHSQHRADSSVGHDLPPPLTHSPSDPIGLHRQHEERLHRAAIHHSMSESHVYGQHAGSGYDQQLELVPGRHSGTYEEPEQFDPRENVAFHHSNYSNMQPNVEDDDSPPPLPPTHRRSAPNSAPRPSVQATYMSGNTVIAPLKITTSRKQLSHGSFDIQCQPNSSQHYASTPNSLPRRAPPSDAGSPFGFADRRQSAYANFPAHLNSDPYELHMTSHDSSPEPHGNPAQQHQHRMSLPHHNWTPSFTPQHSHSGSGAFHTPPRRDAHPLAYEQSATYSSSPREPYHTSPANASPAPLIKPRPVSPAAPPLQQLPSAPSGGIRPISSMVAIPRKSVSPRPQSSCTNFTSSFGGHNGSVPFGPDCFDSLNPSATGHRSATSLLVNTSNQSSAYGTPSHSLHGSTRSNDGLKLDQSIRQSPWNTPDMVATEPIHDYHGNIVDPSDRLPVDSWAPEPEKKGMSFAPKITHRERDRLTGARRIGENRSSGSSGLSVAGSDVGSPSPFAAAVSPGSSLVSTVGNSRSRQQKKGGRPQSSYVSSPSTVHGSSASAGAGNQPYTNATGSNALAKRYSYAPGAPPPISAQFPLDAGPGAGGLDKFSEAMSMIDIGLGPGSSALTKRRGKGFGFGY